MAKKIMIVVVVLVLALAAYVGGKLYASMRNTPERAGNAFMTELASGDVDATYAMFTDRNKQDYTKSSWKNFAQSYAKYDANGAPRLVKQEDLTDRFNTYPEGSKPRRLVYETTIDGKKYQVKMIMFKVDALWMVDDLQGSYAQ